MSFIELPLVNPGEVIESSYNNQNKHNTDYLKVRADKVDKYIVNPLLQIQHTTPAGTPGGTFSAGAWRNRILNTVVVNKIEGASIDEETYAIILPAGEYAFHSFATGYRVVQHVTRLYNITDDEVLVFGSSGYSASGSADTNSHSFINHRFELTKETILQLQHRCSNSYSTHGFGAGSVDFGQEISIFAEVRVYRIGD